MKILLFVSKLPYARPAILFGGLVARLTKSPIILMHVTSRKSGLEAGQNILAQAREMLPDVELNTQICQGISTQCILDEAQSGSYDLVVLEARRTVGLMKRLKGVVARLIARESPVSVLVIKEERPSLKKILVCTGGRDIAEPVIEAGGSLARAAGARVALLHVAPHIPSMYVGLNTMEEGLPALLQTDTPLARHLHHGAEIIERHQIDAALKLRRGEVVNEILDEARAGDYDLIVIGASGTRKGLKEWVLGNITRRIVDDAPCPVMVVR